MATGLAGQLRWQASACAALGSAFYAELLDKLAEDAEAGGITAQVLAGHENDAFEAVRGLRLLGGVHRLVLRGDAPALAAHYPSTGGDGDAAATFSHLLAVLEAYPESVRGALGRPPQTNEVGRAAALVGCLWHLQALRSRPVRLLEIGASGGLNLLADRFRIKHENGGTGPAGSPVVFMDAWRGSPPPAGSVLEVVERLGCDQDPVDASTDEGALTLMSYVWPDQPGRLERLRGALEIARDVRVSVVRASAADFLSGLAPADGAWTVVWHSVMWQYLDDAERVAVLAHLETAGAEATERSPIAHVAFEPRTLGPGDDLVFNVTARTWPGGPEQVLGHAPAHGLPVEWA